MNGATPSPNRNPRRERPLDGWRMSISTADVRAEENGRLSELHLPRAVIVRGARMQRNRRCRGEARRDRVRESTLFHEAAHGEKPVLGDSRDVFRRNVITTQQHAIDSNGANRLWSASQRCQLGSRQDAETGIACVTHRQCRLRAAERGCPSPGSGNCQGGRRV